MPLKRTIEESLQDIGLNLYIARIFRNKSIAEVAKAIKIKPSTLKEIEDGKCRRVPIETLLNICRYYKIDPFGPYQSF